MNEQPYSPLLNELREAFSPDEFSFDFEKYSKDETQEETHKPSLIVIPKDSKKIKTLIRIATKYNVVITPRGAGTGTTGGALPTHGGICLSFENLSKIIDLDPMNRTIVVEPGVITKTIQTESEKINLFYPPDPASLAICSIGGNVAENAGGPRAIKYGVTGDYVLGLKGYYMNGESFSYGGKVVKDVSGYDLKKLLVGSEGTLAIITEITLRLIPKPIENQLLVIEFKTLKTALKSLALISKHGLRPCSAEFIDKQCIAIAKTLKTPFIGIKNITGYLIYFDFDGDSKKNVSTQAIQCIDLIQQYNPLSSQLINTPLEQENWWSFRRSMSTLLKTYAKSKVSHDIVVPISNLPSTMDAIQNLSTKKITVLGYGHLGDGNIHVNVLNINANESDWKIAITNISEKLFRLALDQAGSLTGEHGIGLTKKRFLSWQFSETDISIMKQIKRAFDPKGLLNPGKIFD
ncbi:FAD-binding protein [bacterium]|jgi:glycolate oxidase|nr:FAD-binding protein [bacterium]